MLDITRHILAHFQCLSKTRQFVMFRHFTRYKYECVVCMLRHLLKISILQFDGACYYLRWSTDCLLFLLVWGYCIYIYMCCFWKELFNFISNWLLCECTRPKEILYIIVFFFLVVYSYFIFCLYSVFYIDVEYKWACIKYNFCGLLW